MGQRRLDVLGARAALDARLGRLVLVDLSVVRVVVRVVARKEVRVGETEVVIPQRHNRGDSRLSATRHATPRSIDLLLSIYDDCRPRPSHGPPAE